MSHTTSVGDAGTLPLAEAARDKTREKSKSREHVAYIEYFRAVAILLIVAGHTYALAWRHFIDEDPAATVSALNIVLALVTGGTAYFVFISGFLYRQVFFGRVCYGDFMRKKALYVGLPYFLLATPLIFAELAFGTFTMSVFKDGVAYDSNWFIDYVALFSTGRMVTAYWYIPFVFVVFLASPLFDRFIKLAPAWKAAAVVASIALALWSVRPVDDLNPVHSFLYFANFYMAGIVFCEHRKAIMDFITRPAIMLLFAALLLAIAATQALVLHEPGNIVRLPTDSWFAPPAGLDLMLAQKYAGIFLGCAVLSRWGSLMGRPLSFIADHSFGLFFTHGVVIAIMMRLPAPLSPHVGEPMVDLALYAAVVVAISLAIVVVVKQLAGKYSRYVIGC